MTGRLLVIECRDCTFVREFVDAGDRPANALIDHAKETGHRLSIRRKPTGDGA